MRTTGWRALLPGPLKLSFRGMGGCAAGGGGCAAGGVGGAAGAGSGGCVAIEVGRNEVWERVFVGDEIIKYVDSSFCRTDCEHRILCSFEGAGVRDIDRRVKNIVSGHGRKKLVVVHLGANDVGKSLLRGFEK